MKSTKKTKRQVRHRRIRSKVWGTAERPRLCVFRSSNHIYAQLIDDEAGKVLAQASDRGIGKEGKKQEISKQVGALIAKIAKENKIEQVVFDRGGYEYHGNVKALAEGAREAGLVF